MSLLVQITAQYHENYGGGTWKAKGTMQFNLRVEGDNFLYVKEQSINAIRTLLARYSNEHGRFTYLDHELVFHEPIMLDTAEFEAELKAECEKDF